MFICFRPGANACKTTVKYYVLKYLWGNCQQNSRSFNLAGTTPRYAIALALPIAPPIDLHPPFDSLLDLTYKEAIAAPIARPMKDQRAFDPRITSHRRFNGLVNSLLLHLMSGTVHPLDRSPGRAIGSARHFSPLTRVCNSLCKGCPLGRAMASARPMELPTEPTPGTETEMP